MSNSGEDNKSSPTPIETNLSFNTHVKVGWMEKQSQRNEERNAHLETFEKVEKYDDYRHKMRTCSFFGIPMIMLVLIQAGVICFCVFENQPATVAWICVPLLVLIFILWVIHLILIILDAFILASFKYELLLKTPYQSPENQFITQATAVWLVILELNAFPYWFCIVFMILQRVMFPSSTFLASFILSLIFFLLGFVISLVCAIFYAVYASQHVYEVPLSTQKIVDASGEPIKARMPRRLFTFLYFFSFILILASQVLLLLQMVLVILKVEEYLQHHWVAILTPSWIYFILSLLVIILIFMLSCIKKVQVSIFLSLLGFFCLFTMFTAFFTLFMLLLNNLHLFMWPTVIISLPILFFCLAFVILFFILFLAHHILGKTWYLVLYKVVQ